jgi:hypothetical protein
MSVEKKLKDHKKLIFDGVKNFNLECGNVAKLSSEEWRYFCTEKRDDLNFYEQNWRNYFVKDYANNLGVNKQLINNEELSNLLNDEKILNIFYFEVWGSVLEHKDPSGTIYRYPKHEYNTLLMPISVPTSNSEYFKTFYNKKLVNLEEGEFIKWDVSKIPHYWHFDYPKVNKLFKLLHIDYIE